MVGTQTVAELGILGMFMVGASRSLLDGEVGRREVEDGREKVGDFDSQELGCLDMQTTQMKNRKSILRL